MSLLAHVGGAADATCILPRGSLTGVPAGASFSPPGPSMNRRRCVAVTGALRGNPLHLGSTTYAMHCGSALEMLLLFLCVAAASIRFETAKGRNPRKPDVQRAYEPMSRNWKKKVPGAPPSAASGQPLGLEAMAMHDHADRPWPTHAWTRHMTQVARRSPAAAYSPGCVIC